MFLVKSYSQEEIIFPLSEEKDREDSRNWTSLTNRTIRVVTWFSMVLIEQFSPALYSYVTKVPYTLVLNPMSSVIGRKQSYNQWAQTSFLSSNHVPNQKHCLFSRALHRLQGFF